MKQERGIAGLEGLVQDAKPGEIGSISEVDVRLLEAMLFDVLLSPDSNLKFSLASYS